MPRPRQQRPQQLIANSAAGKALQTEIAAEQHPPNKQKQQQQQQQHPPRNRLAGGSAEALSSEDPACPEISSPQQLAAGGKRPRTAGSPEQPGKRPRRCPVRSGPPPCWDTMTSAQTRQLCRSAKLPVARLQPPKVRLTDWRTACRHADYTQAGQLDTSPAAAAAKRIAARSPTQRNVRLAWLRACMYGKQGQALHIVSICGRMLEHCRHLHH